MSRSHGWPRDKGLSSGPQSLPRVGRAPVPMGERTEGDSQRGTHGVPEGSGPGAGPGSWLSHGLTGVPAVRLPQTTPASPSRARDMLAREPAAETQGSPLPGWGAPHPAQLPPHSAGQSKFLPRPPPCGDATVPGGQVERKLPPAGVGVRLGSDRVLAAQGPCRR